jgi:hypothetical protein
MKPLPLGVYLLDVQSPLYVFSQLKLKVSRENATVNLVEYKFPGAKRVPASYPIVLKAHSRVQYSQPKEGMSIGTFLRNPMAYMVLFLVGIITLMPMLLKNIGTTFPVPPLVVDSNCFTSSSPNLLYKGCFCLYTRTCSRHFGFPSCHSILTYLFFYKQ